jgi:hypothetical protein
MKEKVLQQNCLAPGTFVSAQTVDATHSNRLILQHFSRGTGYARSKPKQGSVLFELNDFSSWIFCKLASIWCCIDTLRPPR